MVFIRHFAATPFRVAVFPSLESATLTILAMRFDGSVKIEARHLCFIDINDLSDAL